MDAVMKKAIDIITSADKDGIFSRRECPSWELKANYNPQKETHYMKAMAGFANSKGGYIFFGIENKPRRINGMTNNFFHEIFEEKFNQRLTARLAPEIQFDIDSFMYQETKEIGYIYTFESENKPVVGLKNDGDIQESDIYYRYYGESRKIKYADLRRLLQEQKDKESRLWMEHLEKILRAGPANIGIVDFVNETFSTTGMSNLLLDKKLAKELLKNIKIVKEGSFRETSGQPVLRLIGDLSVIEEIPVPDLDVNIAYPYIQKDLAKHLGVEDYDVYSLVWKYMLKGKRRFHQGIETGGILHHKFSEFALQFLRDEINRNKDNPSFLSGMRVQFGNRSKQSEEGK